MEDVIDAAAMIGTGAILAREIERTHVPGHDPSAACANCGAALGGAFCAVCGQHGHVHRTAGALLHDLAHGVFHFEGKFWATLPLLAWRPGELTRRYVHGERARFVSPMAMFLFSIFLMFAIVAHLPGLGLGDGRFGNAKVSLESAREKLTDERRKAGEEIARIERKLAIERAAQPLDTEAVSELDRRLGEARQDQIALDKAARLLPGLAAQGDTATSVARHDAATNEPVNWLDAKYRHAKENPQLLLYKLQSSAYKYSWALIPISLPFIWLLFPFRRDVGLYDHAIFATYSLSFMSLLVVALALLGWIGVPTAIIVLAAMIVPPWHIYRQLKGAYRLSGLGAAWRTWWMLNFVGLTTTAFGLLLLYLGTAD